MKGTLFDRYGKGSQAATEIAAMAMSATVAIITVAVVMIPIFVWMCTGISHAAATPTIVIRNQVAGDIAMRNQGMGDIAIRNQQVEETNAGNSQAEFVIVYDRLYDYGTNTSKALTQYMSMKTSGKNVVLQQKDDTSSEEFDGSAIVDFPNANSGVIIAIDNVYPFSDLNRLMDMAEVFNMAGIEYIVSVAPVYENYQMHAYENYIEVLRYISQTGGHLFVRYPIENKSGTYNLDPRKPFTRAVAEFHRRGLEVVGIEIPQDKMFTHLSVYEGLGFQCLLVTEAEKKIPTQTDLSAVSQKLLGYQMINGADRQQCITVSANDSAVNLAEMPTKLHAQQIMIKDFQIDKKYKRSSDGNQQGMQDGNQQGAGNNPPQGQQSGDKTQMEQFLESELEKITGENLQGQETEEVVEGYDISGLSSIVIKVALVILCVLAVLAVIGRYLERKKFYK